MSKKPKPLPPYVGKLFTPGDYVLIQRPHLWSGASGKVEVVDSKTGIHQIRVTAKDGVTYPSGFRADALGDLLVLEDLLA